LNQRSESSEDWIDLITRDLGEIDNEQAPNSIHTRILTFIHRIDERYRGNYDLESSDQLPLAVFERLIEMVASVAEAVATYELYQDLIALPDEIFGKSTVRSAEGGRLHAARQASV
jgi:hypothetical protein